MNATYNYGFPFRTLLTSERVSVDELLRRYATETAQLEEGEATHAVMARGARSADFDENTGGWVWLSYSIHAIGDFDAYALVIAGSDSCSLYLIDVLGCTPETPPAEAAGLVWDKCGDEDAVRIATVYLEA